MLSDCLCLLSMHIYCLVTLEYQIIKPIFHCHSILLLEHNGAGIENIIIKNSNFKLKPTT